MIWLESLCFLLFSAGTVLTLGLTPERIAADLLPFLSPKPTFYTRAMRVRGKKRKGTLAGTILHTKEALEATGQGNRFGIALALSVGLALLAVPGCLLAGNPFLIPVAMAAFAILPFLVVRGQIRSYDRSIQEELETALSIITSSYLRSDNLVRAVEENLPYIKPPLREVFEGFLAEVQTVSADTRACIRHLKMKIDYEIFREWCESLIDCQSDGTLKDTLMPVVNKLTDVRIVNGEMKSVMASARGEYLTMVGMVLANIPMLYLLNKEWYNALLHTLPGKLVLAVCGAVILVTGLCMMKFTKPVAYRK